MYIITYIKIDNIYVALAKLFYGAVFINIMFKVVILIPIANIIVINRSVFGIGNIINKIFIAKIIN